MKPTRVTAFCPGHISGYFKRVAGSTVAATGSIGAGIVISEGVTATVTPSEKTSIRVVCRDVTGRELITDDDSLPVASVMKRLGITASVQTECRLPIGAGFGLSAAALLATLTALDRLLTLHLSPRDIAAYAHETEVTHRTGLGDVAACQGGGRVVRYGPGIDARIERTFDLDGPFYMISFGPIHTPSVLGSKDLMGRVSAAFPGTTPEGPEDFFRLSRQFTVDSGLATKEVLEVLTACEKEHVPASMTMLGNGVFALGTDARAVLESFGRVCECTMARSGAGITGEQV
ncbi:pantoate kinase [Methanoregula sp.]|uniref:pantoate kinase n=1 Tax=Methanoregula sp. TaxID=2052170 RepID=UPI003C793762